MKKVLVLILSLFFSLNAFSTSYKIGVLAKNGAPKCLKQWKATADYLTEKISDHSFEIIPLDFDKVFPAVQNGDVDFFLVNSSMFITAKVKYGASEIATMINSRQGKPLKSFGGVVIAAADNDEINSFEAIKGKSFIAVKESSFGGWQMAYKEILDAGIDPYKDFSEVTFGGKHDNVVMTVLSGDVDAGTVRTDTLERMAANETIDIDEVKVIGAKTHEGFPFLTSTALYPEWPLGKINKTDDAIVKIVVDTLKGMSESDAAAKAAKIVGWTDPLDYAPVEELQKKLKVGAYKE